METDLQKPWGALRGCWAELKCGQARSIGGEALPQDLQQRHARALKALVAEGELATDVAGKVGVAFEQILAHDDGLKTMCYVAFPAEHMPRQDLMGQIAALEEMAGKSDLDPAVVAQVQDGLERNITCLAQFVAGEQPGNASDVEGETSSAEAARVLVELLLGNGG